MSPSIHPVFIAASFSGLVVVALLSVAYGDGRSFLLPQANQTEVAEGFALGVHYDSLGRTWTNPAGFLSMNGCGEHQVLARSADMSVFVGVCTAAAAVVLSLAASTSKHADMVSLVFAACSASLIMASYFMWTLYIQTHPCGPEGQRIQLSTLFRLSYALPAVATCAVLALVNALLLQCTADPEDPQYEEIPVLKTVDLEGIFGTQMEGNNVSVTI